MKLFNIFIVLTVVLLTTQNIAGAESASTTANPALPVGDQGKLSVKGHPDKQLQQTLRDNGFTTKDISRLDELIGDAEEKDLPVAPMYKKVHEGVAKTIEPQRILTAVERVKNRYEQAYQNARKLSGNNQGASQLGNVIAGAMAAGLTSQDLRTFSNQLAGITDDMATNDARRLHNESFIAIRSMNRRGVKSETAVDVVSKALQHSYHAEDLNRLRVHFEKLTRYHSAESIANGFCSAIDSGVNSKGLGYGTSRGGNFSQEGQHGTSSNESRGGSSDAGGAGSSGSSSAGGNAGGGSSSQGSSNSSGGGSGNGGSSGGNSGSGGKGGSSGGNGNSGRK